MSGNAATVRYPWAGVLARPVAHVTPSEGGEDQSVLDIGARAAEMRLQHVGARAQRENASVQCRHPAALLPLRGFPCG
jgi:hypothetical protein